MLSPSFPLLNFPKFPPFTIHSRLPSSYNKNNMHSPPCCHTKMFFLPALLFCSHYLSGFAGGDLHENIEITWGDGRAQMLNNGELLTVSLDRASGSGFQSKNQYLFGNFDMQLKLVLGTSAGTVTSFYVNILHFTSYNLICLSTCSIILPMNCTLVFS